jgi:membrane fusion protein (multidrug efflux system)
MTETGNEPSAGTGPAASGQRRGLNSRHVRIARVVVPGGALIVVVVTLGFWLHGRVRETTDDAQIEGNIVPIAARVGGTVKDVLVDDNQQVAVNAMLVRIDPSDYDVAARKAEAELADARARALAARTAIPITETSTASQLANARAALAASAQEVDAAKARFTEARANHERAASDLERYRRLVEKDEISRQQFDTAVAAETAARSSVESAEAMLSAANSHVAQAEAELRNAGTAGDQVEVSRARAAAAEAVAAKFQAALDQARLNLGYVELRAPVAGIVSRKSVQPGQVIQAGQPLLALVPLDRIWVVANYKEGQLRRMRPGQPASVYVDAYARTYRGHVESIGGATAAKFSLLPPENATGNFVKVVQRVPVKIVLEKDQDPEHLLRPGMSVVPTVLTR